MAPPSPLVLARLLLCLLRCGGAAAGLSDLISRYVTSTDTSTDSTAAAVAARNCATDGSHAACQPRAVIALQNGGPETHPPDESGPTTHRTPAASQRAHRYHVRARSDIPPLPP